MEHQRNLNRIPFHSLVPIICANKTFRFRLPLHKFNLFCQLKCCSLNPWFRSRQVWLFDSSLWSATSLHFSPHFSTYASASGNCEIHATSCTRVFVSDNLKLKHQGTEKIFLFWNYAATIGIWPLVVLLTFQSITINTHKCRTTDAALASNNPM